MQNLSGLFPMYWINLGLGEEQLLIYGYIGIRLVAGYAALQTHRSLMISLKQFLDIVSFFGPLAV